ncbi:nuclease-related domain-containing DEAD/DEAH box helicase [Methylocystis echinoides]|nr:NERD domain-containing protein [Methylocystis echinoides]
MAKMLPHFIEPSVVASERRVFEALSLAKGGENWTVLHSLGLSSEWGGGFGEIDFVVIIPGRGIVCVEVKGGGVAVRNGIWTTRDRWGRTETLKRSPYLQAQEGMWKLLGSLKSRFGERSAEARCPVGWLVVLPDVPCPPLTPEAARDEIIDRDDLDGEIGGRIADAPSLVRLLDRPDMLRPSATTCAKILGFLRPEFERVAAPKSDDWDAETRINALTEEQFEALDGTAENRICLLQGPAGTGKTLIGLEAARRSAALGHAVLLLCFNQNLGRWLAEAVSEFGPGHVVAGNVHNILRERILASSLKGELEAATKQSPPEVMFGNTYFELGALAIAESQEKFDTIVVDEAQDLPADPLAQLLKEWRRDLTESSVLLLGDFTRQAIYASGQETSPGKLKAALGELAIFNLRLNCRNTRRIAYQTAALSGFGQAKLSDRQPEGEQVSVQFYKGASDGLEHLDRTIKALKIAGQKLSEIVVLCPRRRENSMLADRTTIAGLPVRDIQVASPSDLAFSTIHAFKGLERPTVIVIEVAGASEDETDSLLYVAMSRARLRLFLLLPEEARQQIERRLTHAALAAAGLLSQ